MTRSTAIERRASRVRALFAGAAAAGFAAIPAGASAAPLALDETAVPGCWVKFFDDENFQGAQYNYAGPAYVRDLWNFVSFSGSVAVGPAARVILYADPAFEDRTLALESGQRIADLPERTADVHVTFGSMRVRCSR